jgi:hypothetical protein
MDSVTIRSIPKPNIDKPSIKGYRLKWSNDETMNLAIGESDILVCGKGNYLINNLDSSKVYYIRASYVGEFEEGEPSRALCFVPAGNKC